MYNPAKAAQVVAYLALKAPGHKLNVVKAVKLVYLADRASVQRWGAPILDEQRVSMRHGPVNSCTYSFINGEGGPDDGGWSTYVKDRANHEIGAKPNINEDGLDELSDADILCLDEVWERFGKMDTWDLVKWTHDPENIPEWEDHGSSSFPIPLERIMRNVGVPHASEQARLLVEYSAISSLLHQKV